MPPCCARRTRNASLKRASVNTAPIPTTHQYDALKRFKFALLIGLLRFSVCSRSGSRMPNNSRATAINPGMTATQNTARKSLAQSSIKPTASSGPRNAPTVSSDWRRPKAAPRKCAGAMSATIASRGAPRTPFPTLSSKRAVSTSPALEAKANRGLVSAPSA